jgi:hypothetical protein
VARLLVSADVEPLANAVAAVSDSGVMRLDNGDIVDRVGWAGREDHVGSLEPFEPVSLDDLIVISSRLHADWYTVVRSYRGSGGGAVVDEPCTGVSDLHVVACRERFGVLEWRGKSRSVGDHGIRDHDLDHDHAHNHDFDRCVVGERDTT